MSSCLCAHKEGKEIIKYTMGLLVIPIDTFWKAWKL